jgi:hypothetical protein
MRTIKIRWKFAGSNLTPLIQFLYGLDPGGPVATQIVRRAMVLGVMRSLRNRFLDRLQHALQLTTRSNTGDERVREAAAINKQVGRLKLAYYALDEAILSDNEKKITKARDRIGRLRVDIHDEIEKRSKHSAMAHSHRALSVTSALMRSRAQQVLTQLAEPGLLNVSKTADGTTAGLGSIQRLDAIKTPSATLRLMGTPTKSQYNILWRHLEFGTGVSSKIGPKMPWRYGGASDGKAALEVMGSEPMELLFGKGNELGMANYKALRENIEKALDELAPRYND